MKIGFLIAVVGGSTLIMNAGSAQAQEGGLGPSPAPAPRRPPVKAMVLMTTAIPTTDLERAKAFYVKGMGMTPSPGANPRELNLMFPGGGANIMLLLARTPAVAPGAGAPATGIQPTLIAGPQGARNSDNRMILEVPNIRALSDNLVAAGFPAITRVTERPQYGLSVGYLRDPDGNSYELIQRH